MMLHGNVRQLTSRFLPPHRCRADMVHTEIVRDLIKPEPECATLPRLVLVNRKECFQENSLRDILGVKRVSADPVTTGEHLAAMAHEQRAETLPVSRRLILLNERLVGLLCHES